MIRLRDERPGEGTPAVDRNWRMGVRTRDLARTSVTHMRFTRYVGDCACLKNRIM